jgi:hypothetical protein
MTAKYLIASKTAVDSDRKVLGLVMISIESKNALK